MSWLSKIISSNTNQTSDNFITEQIVLSAADYCSRGEKSLKAEKYMEALEYFQAAIETDKHYEKAYLHLSKVYKQQGKIDKAKATLYSLLAIEPNNEKAKKAIDEFHDDIITIPNRVSSLEKSPDNSNQKPVVPAVQSVLFHENIFMVDLPWGVHNRIYVETVNDKECVVVPPIGNRSLAFSNATDCWKGYIQPHGQVTIPNKIIIEGKEHIVTSIGDGAFCLCSNINMVVLPNTIKNIGRYAFCSTSIRKIQLPNSIIRLYNNAFSECRQLETVALPSKLERIHSYVFAETAIKSLDIPSSVSFIGNDIVHNGFNRITIRMHGKPPRIFSSFSGVLYEVYVPEKYFELYKKTQYWLSTKLIPY